MFGCPGQDLSDILLAVTLRKGREADKPFLPFSLDGNIFPGLDLISCVFQFLKKGRKVFRFSSQDRIKLPADTVTNAFLYRVFGPFIPFVIRLLLDYRKAMLQTDEITQLLQSKPGPPEILELAGAIHTGGIKYHMIVDVCPVCMSSHYEGIPALGKSKGKLISDPVGFLCCNLAGLKGLTDLIGDHVTFVMPPCALIILTFLQHEFLIDREGIAMVCRNQVALLCFLRILGIIRPVTKASRHGFALVLMQGDESCCCHLFASLQK